MKITKVIKGWFLWNKLKRKYSIDYKKVVLVLSGQNELLDKKCMDHLPDFKRRRFAEKAIVIRSFERASEQTMTDSEDLSDMIMTCAEMELLFGLYCFYKFFDNIVFTYTCTPADNQLQKFLDETEVNETDAVCLALYHLREVPE